MFLQPYTYLERGKGSSAEPAILRINDDLDKYGSCLKWFGEELCCVFLSTTSDLTLLKILTAMLPSVSEITPPGTVFAISSGQWFLFVSFSSTLPEHRGILKEVFYTGLQKKHMFDWLNWYWVKYLWRAWFENTVVFQMKPRRMAENVIISTAEWEVATCSVIIFILAT